MTVRNAIYGIQHKLRISTMQELAQLMLGRALEEGVPFAWFTGDEVYGSDRKLRLWLERQDIPRVMAIKSNEKLWALTDRGPLQSARATSPPKYGSHQRP